MIEAARRIFGVALVTALVYAAVLGGLMRADAEASALAVEVVLIAGELQGPLAGGPIGPGPALDYMLGVAVGMRVVVGPAQKVLEADGVDYQGTNIRYSGTNRRQAQTQGQLEVHRKPTRQNLGYLRAVGPSKWRRGAP